MQSRVIEEFRFTKRGASLRSLLVYPFVTLIVVAVISTGFLSLYNSGKAAGYMAWQLMDEIVARIEDRVLTFLDKAHLVNEINANTIESGQIDFKNMRQQELHFWHQVRSFEYISYSYIGRSDGGFFGARRLADGTLQTIATETLTGGKILYLDTDNRGVPSTISSSLPYYDHKTRPWYKAAIEAGKPAWSPVFIDAGGEGLAITAATPLHDNSNTIIGVLGCSFTFSHINQFLRTLKIGESGLTFIVERSGMLVATSTLDATYTDDKKRIVSLESENQKINQTSKSISEQFGDFGKIDQKHRLFIHVQSEKYFVQLSPLTDHRGIEWLIVVIIPENDFMSHIKAGNFNTILLSLIALCVTVMVGFRIARSITRPILELNIAAKSIANGEWSNGLKIDRQDEVGELARSFNLMLKNLETTTVSRDRLAEEIEQRKKIESELQRLAAVVEHSSELVNLATMDGKMIFLNDAGGIMLGIPPRDVENHNIMEVYPDHLKSRIEKEVIPALLKEGRWEGELQYRNLIAGTLTDVHAMLFTIRNSDGEVLYLANVSLDITEAKRAEEALRVSEQRLAEIIDFLPDATFAINSQGIVIAWNRAIEEMTAVPKEAMIGKGNLEYSLPFYGMRRPILIDLVFATEEEIRRDYKAVSRIGDTIVAEAFVPGTYGGKGAYLWGIATPLCHKSGEVIAAIESIRDITERKLAEEKLRESEEKFRKIVEDATEGIYQTTPLGRYLSVNPAFAKMFGFSSPEEMTRSITNIGEQIYVNPHDREVLIRMIDECDRVEQYEVEVYRKDRSRFWISINTHTVRDADGNVLYFEGTNVDITERKRAVEALRQSDWEKATLNQISNAFLTVSDDKVYEAVLAVILKALKSRYGIFGYIGDSGELIIPSITEEIWSACQVNGKSIVFPPHLWGNSLWGKAIHERKSFYSEGPFRTPEGHLPVYNFLTVPIVFANKTIGLVSVANKDGGFAGEDSALLERIAGYVSPILNARLQRDRQELDRMRAEEALRASEERLAHIIDFLPDATFAINSEGIIIAWNRAMEEMTGVPDKEMIGKGNLEYSLPFYGKRRPIMIDLVFTSEEEIKKNYVEVSKIGDTIVAETFAPGVYGGKGAYLWCIATPLYDKSGKVTAAIESIRDVTERKLAQETLERAEAKYRAIFENAIEGIFQTTPEGMYITANPTYARMLGFNSPDELMNSIADIGRQIYTDSAQGMEVRRLLTQNGHVKDYHAQLTRKDGTTVWVTIDATVIRDSDGKVLCFQGSMLDITDRRRAAEERKKLEAQLYHAQKMESVGRLAGGVAHDFNNMLSVIIGHTEMAMAGMPSSDRLHDHLQEIQDAAFRSTDLVGQLLAFARKQIVNPRLLDLNETIENMLKMLRRLIGEDIDLVWMPGSGLWHVRMDPSQIDQILANLTVNARDAISGVGSITIETENVALDDSYRSSHAGFIPGEYVQLTVSDSGCGMDRETLDRLFEPFFTTKDLGRGTGLGLATVYGIVKQNDGFINVYSEPSKGAVLRIFLPRFRAGPIHSQEEATSVQEPPQGTETILLVEDDAALLALSKTILEDLGYTVIATQSPKEAIHLVEKHAGDIQLLLTDVVMPGMNGRELAEQLLLIRPTLKCLYMSGYTANMIAHRGILDEGVRFIAKPFRMNDLAKAVRLALARG